jgi:hypothetical protein
MRSSLVVRKDTGVGFQSVAPLTSRVSRTPADKELNEGPMLGFELDIWDYLTFVVIFALIAAFLTIAVLVLGLPGRIAIARKHPDADAINTMGWLGFLAVVPWMQAFMWAFKPTNVVDIRYFPRQEQQNISAEIARLTGKATPEKNQESTQPKTQGDDEPSPKRPAL